jgi:RNA polymerase sigma factor (sigma-70 family)
MRLNLDSKDANPRRRLGEPGPFPIEHGGSSSVLATAFLAVLYRDHSVRLRRFFRGRGSAWNADDLVQETFVRVAAATARKPVAIEQPRAYVNQVAQNLLREQARFAARRSTALHVSEDDVQLVGADPIAHLEARDILKRLEASMAKMTPTTREIFMAHKIDGYTYAEIACRTGRSVKSVEKHIAKAILRVNRAMRGC